MTERSNPIESHNIYGESSHQAGRKERNVQEIKARRINPEGASRSAGKGLSSEESFGQSFPSRFEICGETEVRPRSRFAEKGAGRFAEDGARSGARLAPIREEKAVARPEEVPPDEPVPESSPSPPEEIAIFGRFGSRPFKRARGFLLNCF